MGFMGLFSALIFSHVMANARTKILDSRFEWLRAHELTVNPDISCRVYFICSHKQ